MGRTIMYLYFLQVIVPQQECGSYFKTLGVFSTRKEALLNVTSFLIGNTEFPDRENIGHQRVITFKTGLINDQFVYETTDKWFFNSVSVGKYKREYLRNITDLIDCMIIYDLSEIENQIDLYKEYYNIEENTSYVNSSGTMVSSTPFENCIKNTYWWLSLKKNND